MKKVEKESLVKSFLLFFLSQVLLLGALFFLNYKKELQTLDEQIFSQMRICSFDLQCKNYNIDFVPKNGQELYKLYKDDDALHSYFTIPGSQKHYLQISLEQKKYKQMSDKIRQNAMVQFLLTLFVVAILSFGFALYALSPLRSALHLTEEFVKDILHDFNTPLTTLRLNIASLQMKFQKNKNFQRAQNAIETLLGLQANLRAYLDTHALQKENFFIDDLLNKRIELLASPYSDITIEKDLPHKELFCNKDAFVRIFDNIFSNALKYNQKNGRVSIRLEKSYLIIEDSGKGIKEVKKIFERFYKEQDRGIGIGLHIVKKLCEELEIDISVESKVGIGTTFVLDLSKLILH